VNGAGPQGQRHHPTKTAPQQDLATANYQIALGLVIEDDSCLKQ
jgi:hypothetical protein